MDEGRQRVVIERVSPEIECGHFPIKRVAGEKVVVQADILSDGHDTVSAVLVYRPQGSREWREIPMTLTENDRWTGEFVVEETGVYEYTVRGWVDQFRTWQKDLRKRHDADTISPADILIGIELIEDVLTKASKADRSRLEEIIRILKGGGKEDSVALALSEEIRSLMGKY